MMKLGCDAQGKKIRPKSLICGFSCKLGSSIWGLDHLASSSSSSLSSCRVGRCGVELGRGGGGAAFVDASARVCRCIRTGLRLELHLVEVCTKMQTELL